MVGFRFATLFLFFIFDLGSKAGVVYVFLSMRFLGKWQAGQGVLYGNSWAGCDNRIGYHFCFFSFSRHSWLAVRDGRFL